MGDGPVGGPTTITLVGGAIGAVVGAGAAWTSASIDGLPAVAVGAAACGLVGGLIGGWAHARYRARVRRMTSELARSEESQFLPRLSPERGALGQLSTAINRLLSRLTDLSVQTIDQDRELRWAQEKLELQTHLDQTNQRLEARLRETELLAELTETFGSSLDTDEVLATVCERVAHHLRVDEVAIVLYEEETDELVLTAATGIPDFARLRGMRFRIGEGITGELWDEQPTVYVPDVAGEPRYLGWKGQYAHEHGALVVLRMTSREHRVGLLDCMRRGESGFSPDELRLLRIVADQAATAVRNARLYHRMMAMATHDELTGLLNRRRLMEELDSAWARCERYADLIGILVVDIDRFKAYNDEHGHLLGDEVLRQVARVLESSVRRVDVVGRYGGEEFVIVLPRAGAEAAAEVAEKLRAAIESVELVGPAAGLVGPTVSVGVATARPDDTATALKLLGAADRALLEAKEAGRNRVVVAAESSGAPTPVV